MADTVVNAGSQEEQWADDFFAEYVRESLFASVMGTSENAVIQIKTELGTKAGKTINCMLVTRLVNAGVVGDATLEGNEEALGNFNDPIAIDQIRNAVIVGKMEQKHTDIDLLNAARMMLRLWIMDDLRDDLIESMYSPHIDGSTAYATATEPNKDAWLVVNADRVLFGAAVSNNGANDHSAALLNVDAVGDVLTVDIVRLAKRRAKTADRHIRPVRIRGAREWYVLFCESLAYRDLKSSADTIHQNAGVRGNDNVIFTDADLILDGVTVREVPEIPVIAGVGAAGIDVSGNFLSGGQSLGLAWGQRSQFQIKRDFDYNNKTGVSIGEVRGAKKLVFNGGLQNGQHTIYAAAVADA